MVPNRQGGGGNRGFNGALPAILVLALHCAGARGSADAAPGTVADTPAEVLEEIIVERPRLDATESDFAIKSKAPLRELPLSVEVLDGVIIDSARHANLASLLDSYTLGGASPGERGLYDDIVLRGFAEAPFYRDGHNDSLGALQVRDLANVESVEVLKGPNAAIYGQGEPGGSINLRTKKPLPQNRNSARAALGSYGRYRVEFDSTGPVTGDDELAYRLIGALEDADSFRDFVNASRVFAAPSISWKAGEPLELLGSVEYIRHDSPFDSGVVALDGAFPLPRSRFLGEPEIGNMRIAGLTAELGADWEIGDALTFSATGYRQDSDLRGLKVEPVELDDFDPSGPSAILARELQDEVQETEVVSVQAELEYGFEFSGIGNRVLAGYEYSSIKDREDVHSSDAEDESYEIDIFNVEYGQPRPAMEAVFASSESSDLHAVYIQDFAEIGEHWRVLAGTRLDMIDSSGSERIEETRFDQEDEEFSSRVGAVYLPNAMLSVFASFSESFDPNEGLNPQRQPLQPTRGRAVEGGIKLRVPVMDLSFEASAFRIEQTDVTTDAPNAPGFEIQTARQLSRGLDLELLLKPGDWAQLGVKYGYTDAEISDDPEIPDGTTPLNAPRHKLLVFGLFSFSLRHGNDLQAGINLVHISKRQASLDPDELEVTLPGYTTGNAFADYALSGHVILGVNVSNFLDKDYLSGSQSDLLHIAPGPPLTVFTNIRVHF